MLTKDLLAYSADLFAADVKLMDALIDHAVQHNDQQLLNLVEAHLTVQRSIVVAFKAELDTRYVNSALPTELP